MMMVTAKMMMVIAHWFCNRAQLSPRKNQIETLRQKAADPTRTHKRRMRPSKFKVKIERITHKAICSQVELKKIGLKKSLYNGPKNVGSKNLVSFKKCSKGVLLMFLILIAVLVEFSSGSSCIGIVPSCLNCLLYSQ